MIIQYASDLHLEFSQNKKFLEKNPLQAKGDVLLLAGDIVPFAVMNEHEDFFDYVSDHFRSTYWIPGNHEYYYYDLAGKSGELNENIRSNVHLVNNVSVLSEGVRLIFSTLWTRISPARQWEISTGMSDFRVIKFKGHRLLIEQYNQLHEEALDFIRSELQESGGNETVVVTHHIPTFLNYPEIYKTSVLNEAFAVELFDLIEATQPDYWIYGHHHCNNAFEIGNTRLLTNQLGYVEYGEHWSFDPSSCFQLSEAKAGRQ